MEFSATRLRELAKMDGAIVTDAEAKRITRAAVQLVPDSAIETSESGTRHRTAERVAKQTGFPVISVSQSMRIVALYVGGGRYVLEASDALLAKANQALATLERYKARLDEVTGTLSALEIENRVTVRDVAIVVQRLEMVRRISEEIAHHVVELGTDGRLLSLQLDDLIGGVSPDRELVIRDYLDAAGRERSMFEVLDDLSAITSAELVDLVHVAGVLGFAPIGGQPGHLGAAQGVPAAEQGATDPRHHRRTTGRALRRPAGPAGGQPRGPDAGRGGRRAACAGGARGSVPRT